MNDWLHALEVRVGYLTVRVFLTALVVGTIVVLLRVIAANVIAIVAGLREVL